MIRRFLNPSSRTGNILQTVVLGVGAGLISFLGELALPRDLQFLLNAYVLMPVSLFVFAWFKCRPNWKYLILCLLFSAAFASGMELGYEINVAPVVARTGTYPAGPMPPFAPALLLGAAYSLVIAPLAMFGRRESNWIYTLMRNALPGWMMGIGFSRYCGCPCLFSPLEGIGMIGIGLALYLLINGRRAYKRGDLLACLIALALGLAAEMTSLFL